MSAEKEGFVWFDICTRHLYRRVYSVLRARRIWNAGFSRRIMANAFNKLAIFFARYWEGGFIDSRHVSGASGPSVWIRRKALLMRSLIRQISKCFAARSDVYPSRSATTRWESIVFLSPATKRDSTLVYQSLSPAIHLNVALFL